MKIETIALIILHYLSAFIAKNNVTLSIKITTKVVKNRIIMLGILKFKPIFKERIWGGRKMEQTLGKKLPEGKVIGESWELSGVEGDISVVSEGPLKGNTLQELIETYMGDLVGDSVYERFGEEFPLLIKLIDAQDYLSIQVHPDDELSKQRHHSYGKTEMWYIVENEPGAQLYLGFNQKVDKAKYMDYLEKSELEKLLKSYVVKKDDAFFIPAGAIHAIGKGIVIAEIQQTSDITYRVYDFNRKDDKGNPRELHTELALDAIDYTEGENYDVTRTPVANQAIELTSCQYFETNTLLVAGVARRDYSQLDSFVIYICLEGTLTLSYDQGETTITRGETVLIPALVDNVELKGSGKVIETYVP